MLHTSLDVGRAVSSRALPWTGHSFSQQLMTSHSTKIIIWFLCFVQVRSSSRSLTLDYVFLQMRPVQSSVEFWSTVWPASAARSRSPWPIWCRDWIFLSMMRTTLSRGKSPTFPPTSTLWASSWTLRGRWVCTVPVTTARPMRSSSFSPRQPITTSSSWTHWNRHED